MAPEFFKAISEGGACLDLSDRTKILVSGADRIRYLNGQLTNDVRKVSSAREAVYACVTSLKGRIEADVFLHATPAGDELLLDAEPGLREALPLRLDKYIVADDVTLDDVTDAWKLLHVFGAATPGLDTRCAGLEGVHRVPAMRMGEPGVDLWIPSAVVLTAWPGLMLSAEDAETLRIVRGIPRWPHELNADAFPQEARLETRAMDFTKGCYIGQEILSRIKTTGKMPRTLMQWTAQDGGGVVEQGSLPLPLHFEDAEGVRHEAGVMTSAVRHPLLDRWTGLGYVRQGQAQTHSVLLAGDGPTSICIDVNYLKA